MPIVSEPPTSSIPITDAARNTFNPIRAYVEGITAKPNPEKSIINLGLGDPTVYGLRVPKFVEDAVVHSLQSGAYNGYCHSKGDLRTREAIATKFSIPSFKLTAEDIVVTSGCSHAIYLPLLTLAQKGDNVLIPAPGFPLYTTICGSLGVEVRKYRLIPERSFEIDLEHLESLIDSNTKCVIMNNPSNPCGSSYSKEHLLDFLNVMRKYNAGNQGLVVLADEIYADMVFPGRKFHFLAELSQDVPIISVGGMAKRFLVPGWRIGWTIIQDKTHKLDEVRVGLTKTAQLILSSNTVVHGALPEILSHPDEEIELKKLMVTLEKQFQAFYHGLYKKSDDGFDVRNQVSLIEPQGAMYCMGEIRLQNFSAEISTERDFLNRLYEEQSVLLLPGTALSFPNSFRVVICANEEIMRECAERIYDFCKKISKDLKQKIQKTK